MSNFLLDNYSFLYRFIIAFSAITGLLCYKKYKNETTKYFIWFLVYILLFELFAGYPSYIKNYSSLQSINEYLKGTKFETNYWVYNLFWNILSTVFLSFYFFKIIKSQRYKLIVKSVTSIFILFSIVYISFNFDSFFNSSIIPIKLFAAGLVLLNVIFYLIEILNGDKILTFYKSFNFYVSAALLIWWLVTTPVVFYQIYFSKADLSFVYLRWQIFLLANYFLYSAYTFALIYCKPEHK